MKQKCELRMIQECRQMSPCYLNALQKPLTMPAKDAQDSPTC